MAQLVSAWENEIPVCLNNEESGNDPVSLPQVTEVDIEDDPSQLHATESQQSQSESQSQPQGIILPCIAIRTYIVVVL